MRAAHLVLLVEEPSMEAFLRELLPRLVPSTTFEIHAFQGKSSLIGSLESRLRAYSAWFPTEWRMAVVVDRDDDDCRALKQQLEEIALRSHLRTRSASRSSWQLINCIAIEELEAWYFGDWDAVRMAYPRTSANVPRRHGFRDPDAILGGTWEAFERILQKHGYFAGGLAKLDAARRIGAVIDPSRSRSKSFKLFCEAIADACG